MLLSTLSSYLAVAVTHPARGFATAACGWLDNPTQRAAPEGAIRDEAPRWPDMSMDQGAIMRRLLTDGAALFAACWQAPVPRLVSKIR